MTKRRAALVTAIASLGAGVLAANLVLDQQPGLGYTLFLAAVVGILLSVGNINRLTPLRSNWWLLAPVLVFGAMLTLRTNATMTAINVLAVLGSLGLLVATWDRHDSSRLKFFGYGATLAGAAVGVALRGVALVSDGAAALGPRHARQFARPMIAGILIAAPFLGLFTILFASADAIFSNAIQVTWRNLDLGSAMRHTAFALAVAWLTRGTLAVALADRIRANGPGAEGVDHGVDEPVRARGRLGIGETSVALGLILALFATFVVFQLRYLFLPPERLGYTFETVTYSEYAREGFFQLLVVTGVAILLMVSLDGWTRRLEPLHHWIFNGLTLALIASTFVIVASSFRRLQLYGFEHSFTHLRLFSHSFTVLLGVVLVLLAVAVLISRPRVFAFGTLVTLMMYAAALDLLNPDAFIATANLDHRSLYGKELDLRNLVPLGEDAVPVLVSRLDELDPPNRRAVSQLLELQLERTRNIDSRTGWQSANTSRQEARRRLEPRAAELAAACILTDASSAALARRSSVERQQEQIHTLQPLC